MMQRMGWIAIVTICLLLSCKRDDLPFYSGGKKMVMVKPWEGEVAYSYTEDGMLADTSVLLAIPIFLLGADGSDTAIRYAMRYESDDLGMIGYPGKEVVRLDSVFDRGAVTDTLFLKFLRDTTYLDSVYALRIFLEVGPEYSASLLDFDDSSFVSKLEVRIEDRFEEPVWWEGYKRYIGAFSSRKMRVIGHWLGLAFERRRDFEYRMDNQIWQDPAGFGRAFREFLEQQAAAGSPVLERNGEPMRSGDEMYPDEPT